jgi:hypothetical protein
VRNLRKAGAKTVRDQLSSSDTHIVQSNHATTILCRGNLGNIQGDNHCCRANAETNNETTDSHLSQGVSTSLEDGTDDEKNAPHIDSTLSSKAISCKSGSDGANKGTARSDGCDQFLLARGENLAKIIVKIDEDCRDNSSIVAFSQLD